MIIIYVCVYIYIYTYVHTYTHTGHEVQLPAGQLVPGVGVAVPGLNKTDDY